MKIAYLSAPSLLLDSGSDPVGQSEFRIQFDCLSTPLSKKGIQLQPIAWSQADIEWRNFDAALIGPSWDYWEESEAFLRTLQRIEVSGRPLFNSHAQVSWNSRKTYLQDLGDRGVQTIPTLWLDHPTPDQLQTAFSDFGTDRIVLKRQIGVGSYGQFLLKTGEPVPEFPFPAMVQPFISSIQTFGELSFLFVDGVFSHALIKRPKTGDYRIQGHYGGWEERYTPDTSELTMAQSVLDHLREIPLYARVDMVKAPDQSLWLIELELIEPYLYPEQADDLGERFAEALERRLA